MLLPERNGPHSGRLLTPASRSGGPGIELVVRRCRRDRSLLCLRPNALQRSAPGNQLIQQGVQFLDVNRVRLEHREVLEIREHQQHHLRAHVRHHKLGHHQAQMFHRASAADAAVTYEPSRFVVPLPKQVTMELLDLSEATQEVVALSLGELRRNRVIVRTACAHELPPVYGDRVQLQQVILNLLLNASEAMRGVDDRPRQLLIGTNLDEDGNVRLTVQDAGVGFESKDIDRLFESFYTTKTDGMGIGLSLSRSIIEGHRGHIWAEPNFSGPGATFSFAIPRAPEDATNSLGPGVLQPCTAAAAGAFAGNP